MEQKVVKQCCGDFLKENRINNSFNRGYFLHLITDYLFYNKYLEYFSKDIYNDYDILNKPLIEKYKVIIPDSISDKCFFNEGETKVLNLELAKKLIDEISDLDIDEIEKEINNNPSDPKWITFNPNIQFDK